MIKKYCLAALGGTFDHLHLGHHQLLTRAFNLADQVIIGVVHDARRVQKDYPASLESYSVRLAALKRFLTAGGYQPRFHLVPLNDPYGPTLKNNKIDLLVASKLTKAGVQELNNKRVQLQLQPLPVHWVNLVKDRAGQPLSSTRIRQGLVDRQGQVWAAVFSQPHLLTLRQRQLISQPQGKIIPAQQLTRAYLNRFYQVALLGDETTEVFLKRQLPFHYAVIDYLVNRQPHPTDWHGFKPAIQLQATNPPGTIQPSAARRLAQILSQPTGLLVIKGEEDLLGFPLLANLPLNSAIFYGQPGKGLVMVPVTEANKIAILGLLN
ncbi:hypothetical protein A2W24_06130 [Microgenomates group bacterium RBG_16_45_19]|nr:MAG: hypothetical protein A2W24_06130 [Microgenomates group bacterium RBG_16_45_19]